MRSFIVAAFLVMSTQANAGESNIKVEQLGAPAEASAAASYYIPRLTCYEYINGYYDGYFVLYQDSRANGTLWLGNVKLTIQTSFLNRTASLRVVDNYKSSARTVSRFPANVTKGDFEMTYEGMSNRGLERYQIRCRN